MNSHPADRLAETADSLFYAARNPASTVEGFRLAFAASLAKQQAQAPSGGDVLQIDGHKGEEIRSYVKKLQRVRFLNHWLADAYANELHDIYKARCSSSGKDATDARIEAGNKVADLRRNCMRRFESYWPDTWGASPAEGFEKANAEIETPDATQSPQEPTIAQAVPYDELVQMWKRAHSAHNSEYSIDWYKAGFRDAEACHGIATHPQVIDKVDAAARDVLAERQRQISAEGWTPAHDDEHADHEMAHAAACYAYPELTALVGVKTWPWGDEWFKVKDHRSNYVRAAALLLAEIERLDRAAIAATGEGQKT